MLGYRLIDHQPTLEVAAILYEVGVAISRAIPLPSDLLGKGPLPDWFALRAGVLRVRDGPLVHEYSVFRFVVAAVAEFVWGRYYERLVIYGYFCNFSIHF